MVYDPNVSRRVTRRTGEWEDLHRAEEPTNGTPRQDPPRVTVTLPTIHSLISASMEELPDQFRDVVELDIHAIPNAARPERRRSQGLRNQMNRHR